jgi:hypothetical protein
MKKLRDYPHRHLWFCRLIIGLLAVFILLNKEAVIERYNPSAWWGITSAAFLAWLFAEWALRNIHASWRARHMLVVVGATAVYADSFGTMAHYYDDIRWYDKPMHFLGTAAVALWLWYVLRTMLKKQRIRLPLRWHMWLVLTTASFFGLLFEIFEYTADTLFVEDGHYWIGPAPDTVEDILMNTLGALTVVGFMGWKEKGKKNTSHG